MIQNRTARIIDRAGFFALFPRSLVKGRDWVSQNRVGPCSRRFRAGVFREIPAWKFGSAPVLKKVLTNAMPCAIIPKLKEKHLYRGVEQLAARRAHNPEVGGSSPPSATRKQAVFL